MANRKISDLTALTAPVTGDLLPIVDISEAAAADKNKKITYGTFLSSVPLGTAAAPSIAFLGDTNTGIYSPGADQLAISTGGIGRLAVSTTAVSSTLAVDVPLGAVGTPSLTFTGDLNTGIYSPGADQVAVATGGVQRINIGSSGGFYVGHTANPVSARTIGVSLRDQAGGGIAVYQTTSSSDFAVNSTSGSAINFYSDNGALVYSGSISVNGNITTYGSISDYRLKENIQPMTGALAKVLAINPVTYTFKDGGQVSQGFIAHELQSIIPDAVIGTKDEVDADGKPKYQGVDTSFLVATLTAAIQELKAIIDTQATRLSALEGA